jgi:hypothetical protein
MAKHAQVSDWITKTRTLYNDALDLFGRYQALAQEGQLTGRILVNVEGVTTNLTDGQFIGANEGLDVTAFVGAFAALGAAFSAVSNADTALLFESR